MPRTKTQVFMRGTVVHTFVLSVQLTATNLVIALTRDTKMGR